MGCCNNKEIPDNDIEFNVQSLTDQAKLGNPNDKHKPFTLEIDPTSYVIELSLNELIEQRQKFLINFLSNFLDKFKTKDFSKLRRKKLSSRL